MAAQRIATYILQGGVAFSLLYPPIAAISDPYSWIGYFPSFIQNLPIETMTLLHVFGVVEVVLALWILSGWRIYIPSAITAVLLIAIVVFNMSQFPVLFRDISIAAAAIALVFIDYERMQTMRNPQEAPEDTTQSP